MTQSENLVKNTIEKLQKKGLSIIYAKCSGYSNPDKLQGAEPDFIGWGSDKQLLHVGLVADSKILSSKTFKEKFDTLKQLSMASGNSRGHHVPFYLALTEEARTSNKDLAGKLTSQDTVLKINN